jgi:carotenoid cleavage dioxygenase-like enzyme
MQELNAVDLNPKSVQHLDQLNPVLKGAYCCPHMHHDPRTGEWIGVSVEHGYQQTQYHVFSIVNQPPAAMRTAVVATVSDHPTILHSFSVTDNYIILVRPIHPLAPLPPVAEDCPV